MHTTVALDAIRGSGQLFASTGCLLAAVYCAPLTSEPGGLRPHNLGAFLLETKPHTRTLIFEVTPTAPMTAHGIEYLRTGLVHLDAYREFRSYLTPAEDSRLRAEVTDQIYGVRQFLNSALACATGQHSDGSDLVDQLSQAVERIPFLGYLYFEVVAEYLMLHSTSRQTKALAERGELNSRLSKALAFAAAPGMAQLFDPGRFSPNHQQLEQLVAEIDPSLAEGSVNYAARRLAHLYTTLALTPGDDAVAGHVAARHFETLADTVPGLVGQLVFRQMRLMARYPQLYLAIEQAKAHSLWSYWNRLNITVPFNGSVPKGEVGLNTAHPDLGLKAWVAVVGDDGLLHPGEELQLVPVPRLADLSLTAMRRDHTGRAAGHPQGDSQSHPR